MTRIVRTFLALGGTALVTATILGGCCMHCTRPAAASVTPTSQEIVTCSGSGWVETTADGVIVSAHGPLTLESVSGSEVIVVQAGETWYPTSDTECLKTAPATIARSHH